MPIPKRPSQLGHPPQGRPGQSTSSTSHQTSATTTARKKKAAKPPNKRARKVTVIISSDDEGHAHRPTHRKLDHRSTAHGTVTLEEVEDEGDDQMSADEEPDDGRPGLIPISSKRKRKPSQRAMAGGIEAFFTQQRQQLDDNEDDDEPPPGLECLPKRPGAGTGVKRARVVEPSPERASTATDDEAGTERGDVEDDDDDEGEDLAHEEETLFEKSIRELSEYTAIIRDSELNDAPG